MNTAATQIHTDDSAEQESSAFVSTEFDELCLLFAKRAAAVDTGGPMGELIQDNVRRLARFGFFGAGISSAYGGLSLTEAERRDAVEQIAAACGATAFAQNQLHAGGAFVSGASDEQVKQELLPVLANGSLLCGVAFAHLRRSGKPVVTAAPLDDDSGGFLINGAAPWISVWGLLDAFILGATIESTGEMLFCYVDRRSAAEAGAVEASEPMQLAVMTAADTISLKIRDLVVPARYILQRRDADYMQRSDFAGITSHVTLPLGCARGSAEYLASLAPNQPQASEAAMRLNSEIADCRAQSIAWSGSRALGSGMDADSYKTNALRVRAEAINLALRAAETAIAASGGKAHLLTHPAQRRLREAGFYATMAMTSDTQTALMETFTHAC